MQITRVIGRGKLTIQAISAKRLARQYYLTKRRVVWNIRLATREMLCCGSKTDAQKKWLCTEVSKSRFSSQKKQMEQLINCRGVDVAERRYNWRTRRILQDTSFIHTILCPNVIVDERMSCIGDWLNLTRLFLTKLKLVCKLRFRSCVNVNGKK